MLGQPLDPQGRVACQRVARTDRRGQLLAREPDALDLLRSLFLEREGDIEAPVVEHVEHPLGGAFADAHLDVGELGGERRQDRGDVELPAEQQGSHGQAAADQAAQLLHLSEQRLALGQDGAGARGDERPSLGRLHRARRPSKQLDPELLLEALNLMGHRRLGDVELVGGAGEVSVAGDGLEVAELAQIHLESRSIISHLCVAALNLSAKLGS
jgi:hypothetical protein